MNESHAHYYKHISLNHDGNNYFKSSFTFFQKSLKISYEGSLHSLVSLHVFFEVI